MRSLYTPEEAARMGRRARAGLIGAAGLGAGALAACIFLCTQVRTANAQRLLLAVIGLSTFGGWAFILLYSLVYRPGIAEYRHITRILQEPEEVFQGRLTVSPMAFRIPRSIPVRRAALTDGEETVALTLDARFAKHMPKNGTRVRVTAAQKFIKAVEILDENG